jgi:TatD DNase family protein
MFIDTHCHLNFKSFDKDLDDVIKRAKVAKIGKIIIPGAKIDSSIKAIKIAGQYSSCFASVGIHPHHVDEYISSGKKVINDKLKELINNNKVVSIGEIGLDYHVYKGYPEITKNMKKLQKDLFILQLLQANKFGLPVIIHSRDSYNDVIEILDNFIKKGQRFKGVFHCFSGQINNLKKVLKMGLYIGFDGNITYPENINLQKMVLETPLNRLLLETDSPYLAPIPFRTTRNEPSNISHIASMISKIKKTSISQIVNNTTNNAISLFSI